MADVHDHVSGRGGGAGAIRYFSDFGDGTYGEAVAARLFIKTGGIWVEWDGAVSGGGGGGGAVTVADGADVAQGATTDASSANTVVGILKAIKAAITGTLAVSGTFWQATQPVSGPLTDTQLRASVVPTNDPGLPDTLGQKTMANSTGVALASDQASIPVAATLTAETTKVIGTVNQGTSPWVTAESVPTVVTTGKTSTVTAGTRVQLATNTAKSITIKALAANTGTIYVGNSAVAASNGFALAAGDTVSLDVSNSNVVYIDSSVNAEGVTWLVVN